MLLRDGAVYIIARIIPSALGFLTTMLLTWTLPPDAYGLYGLGMAAIMLGSNVLFDWLSLSVLRWYQTHGQDTVFLSTVLSIFGAVCLGSALLLALVTLFGLTGGHAREAWLFLVGTWAYAWFEFAARFQVGRFRPWRYLAMNFARNVGILTGSLLLARLTHAAEPVLAVSFLAMALGGCLFVADGSLRWRPVFDRELARSLVSYGAPMGLTMIFFGLTTSINRVMLEALSTSASVGDFTIGFALVQNSMGVIAVGIGAATYSAAVRAVESGDAAAARIQLRRNYSVLLALLLPAGAGLALLAPQIAVLLISPRYHEAVVLTTPWLAATAVLMGMRSQYVDTAFQLGKRPGLLAQVMGISAVINIALGFVLIPRFSYLGACVAMFIAFMVAFIHASLLARRAYPLPFPHRETARIALATVVMMAILAATRSWSGLAGLASAIVLASCSYAVMMVMLNVLGLRDAMRERWVALV